MNPNQWWKTPALAAACTSLFLGGCLTAGTDDPQSDEDVGSVDQDSLTVAAGCTSVKMTEPLQGFEVGAGYPITLTGVATCAPGVTPEYQYWAKPASARNWTVINPGEYLPGSLTTWTIPWAGPWSLTAAVRGVGSKVNYEARSNGVSGTAIHLNLNPVLVDDDIATTVNLAGSVDVLANDSDPDGETVSLTGHTEPSHGTVEFVGSVATYTPAQGYVGLDSFTYSASDGVGGAATGNVNISVTDQAPIANNDVLMAKANAASTINVLSNDSDPDGDTLTVSSFTQGAHGSVAFTGGIATYIPAPGYVGPDSFSYTIDDGHELTATATVTVTVTNPLPGCSISASGPASGVYGQNLHLVASAACNTGPAQVQWYHRVNSSYVVVRAWSATLTLDYTADLVGPSLFYAQVRTLGTTASQGTSNTVTIAVVDNTPQCTTVKVTSPVANQTLRVGMAQPLNASATCPAGSTPEFQFWVKASASANWTILPGYTTGGSSWTPAVTGAWFVKAVVRTVGSHVSYQLGSSAIAVNVTN